MHALVPTDTAGTSPATPGADLVVALVGSRVAEDVGDAARRLRARDVSVGRAGAEHRLRPGGGGAGGRGDRLGTGRRRDRAVGARRRAGGRQAGVRRCAGGGHHLPQRHPDGHRAARRAARARAGTATAARPRRPSGRSAPGAACRVLGERRNDDVETLARAEVVIGVGTGVDPEEYGQLSPLAALLGAELAATRKVTDRGWAPRARQVGLTGRSIAPRLYVGLGLSGKFNHTVGVRAAGTILAVNTDPGAPVFAHCDVGIVGDWHEVVPLLHEALRRSRPARDGVGSVG